MKSWRMNCTFLKLHAMHYLPSWIVQWREFQITRQKEQIPFESTLCKCPKSLHVLWEEYEFGVGGRKAAKLFSSRERGRVKFNYSLRNHFWLLMSRMIQRGYTHTAAIDKIYNVYGTNLSATQILREIRKDTKNGGHPQLRWNY